ncbi:MAG: hypothetical protein MAG715_00675 [Methanonatronarchaeales archaeon]|nr:hypothetical protein [Methanonatronarchaeales archaeon]
MRVAVVGGGLAGLSAAMDLSCDFDVDLYESRPRLGGALGSVERDGYHVERFYHHLFRGDGVLLRLIEGLGLDDRLDWRIGTTSFYVNGEVHPLNTPIEILRYPHLSLVDKARLALFVRSCRGGGHERYDDVPAPRFIKNELGDSVYDSFFRPLLRSKFGDNAGRVSAAWVRGRAYVRSHRTYRGEVLGYLRGGFQSLVEGMRREVETRGGSIHTESPVAAVEGTGDSVEVEVAGDTGLFDAAVMTCAPPAMERVLAGFESDVKYQGVCCMLAAADEPLLDDTYWLNLTGSHPFGAVIQHTNLVQVEDYGEHLFYLVSYNQSQGDGNLVDPVDEVAHRFLAGVDEMFPGAPDVNWWTISRGMDAAPVYETGYLEKIVPPRLGDGVYAAGMFSRENYPERSMDGSIRAGLRAAGALRSDLND